MGLELAALSLQRIIDDDELLVAVPGAVAIVALLDMEVDVDDLLPGTGGLEVERVRDAVAISAAAGVLRVLFEHPATAQVHGDVEIRPVAVLRADVVEPARDHDATGGAEARQAPGVGLATVRPRRGAEIERTIGLGLRGGRGREQQPKADQRGDPAAHLHHPPGLAYGALMRCVAVSAVLLRSASYSYR